jgi:hypothetical protein
MIEEKSTPEVWATPQKALGHHTKEIKLSKSRPFSHRGPLAIGTEGGQCGYWACLETGYYIIQGPNTPHCYLGYI